jgi:E3 ubiquitin-protein ligase RFWD2
LSWNKHEKNHIASSDYEGIVTVWDVTTRQSLMEYEEHEKRAWSVDFSRTEPSMLVSGSDDCKVKVWCTRQEASVINIDMKANICCVKYNPGSSNYIAVGSADHHIHYYDLRNISQPLHVFSGHKKAVSYVKFLSNNELASASTDSTLRLWDVKDNLPVRLLPEPILQIQSKRKTCLDYVVQFYFSGSNIQRTY